MLPAQLLPLVSALCLLVVSSTVAAWSVVVMAMILLLGTLYRLYRRPSKTAFLVVLALTAVALSAWLSARHWPWWRWHVLAEMQPLASLSFVGEGVLLVFHFSSYLIVPLAIWMVRGYLDQPMGKEKEKKKWKRVIEIGLWLVILFVVLVDSCLVAHLVREVEAQEAAKAIAEISSVAKDLATDSADEVSPFVIRDQAITKIVSQIHTMVRAEFPELGPLGMSLHMLNAEKVINADKVITVVQVGREVRRESLPLYEPGAGKVPGSLVAAAILDGERKYCSDIRDPTKPGDCKYYDTPRGGEHHYNRIACFPLSSVNQDNVVIAGICVDGISDYPWGDRLNDLENKISEQASSLNALLPQPSIDASCLFRKPPTTS